MLLASVVVQRDTKLTQQYVLSLYKEKYCRLGIVGVILTLALLALMNFALN